MYWLRRATILTAIFFAFAFVAWLTPRVLDPIKHDPSRRLRDRRWVDSSPYFLDRQSCRWLSICGLHHLRKDPAEIPTALTKDQRRWREWQDQHLQLTKRWDDVEPAPRVDKKRSLRDRRRVLKDVPDYVLKHAPLVHLYSGEHFWPSDIREHIEHMTPHVGQELINSTDPWTLHNLHDLDQQAQRVILRSNDDVESRPDWLHSDHNIPSPFDSDDDDDDGDGDDHPTIPPARRGRYNHQERTTWYDVDKDHPLHRISDPRRVGSQPKPKFDSARKLHSRGHRPDDDGYSKAPAVLVLVDKGSGVLDAFWFFFYSYNLGQTVLGIRFGNHVGDWEHCMMRFENGEPRAIFFSEHEGGQAYAYEAVEKYGDRPVIYSAVGSHAMYALPGTHPYILPFRLLKDETDKGPIWDPSLNNYAYHYDYVRAGPVHEDVQDLDLDLNMDLDTGESLFPAASNPSAPTSWFHFSGRWGDEVYSLADIRQWRLFGQYHYVTGPQGPKFKHLDRSKVCQTDRCKVLYELDPKGTWY
ncbi:hypothetical protein S40293_07323 [Stachybotrys chartarum IBT 40293]|nr:hypothetical protein S40293_07323 [Stachybotrys chartarum IBT 40293]